ncbi:hypothetical protein OIU91_17770 [Streptomyces sp. NBC_01456]|uniref:hypothetical protein n=1 Tax=unclassified Streptomyces TaxID=2593676 RepID=UPI002E37FC46|nr:MULTISPECIES: hypothetical protein [unclassified Streptomyces]
MTRHPFEPARLLAGLAALTVGLGYGLDALGVWRAPGLWLFLVLPVGLALSGAAAAWTSVRRHRTPPTDAPPPSLS